MLLAIGTTHQSRRVTHVVGGLSDVAERNRNTGRHFEGEQCVVGGLEEINGGGVSR